MYTPKAYVRAARKASGEGDAQAASRLYRSAAKACAGHGRRKLYEDMAWDHAPENTMSATSEDIRKYLEEQ